MPRTCIICGASANSREHIFPAALGGLRVNRGIYCEQHNNAFSDHANILSLQFGVLNAQLGIRDRDKRPRVVNITTRTGDEVMISTGQVRWVGTAPPDPTTGIEFTQTFGGPEGLAAFGYVALTFFAHYFGDAARQDGMATFKDFIQGRLDNQFVWWERGDIARDLPVNPFPFGHTIVLTTSAARDKAQAIISLFQTFTFGIALGAVPGAADRTVAVFIDPLAEREPTDIQEHRADTVEVWVDKPEPLQTHLERMIRQGERQDRFQDLQTRIERWIFDIEMEPVMGRLNAVRTLPSNDRVRTIQRIVEEKAGRVHRVAHYAVLGLRKHAAGNPDMEPLLAAAAAQIAPNETGDGLSEEAEIPFGRVVAAFILELYHKLEREPVDMNYLRLLFNGGPGMHLAGRTMFEPLRSYLQDPRNLAPDSGA